MSQADRIVVVGAGLAGLRAAERLRELGFSGELVIIGAEALPPYHRPALSKQLLTGAMRPNDLTLPAYQEIGAKWRLGTTARSLSPNNRILRLPGGEELRYDGLIIATGVEARRLNDVPYHDQRVMVMRTLPDALALERAIAANRGPVAVVGGGFTGCEIAASLRHMGREVTIIGRSPTLLGDVLGRKLGDWLTGLHRDHGVDLALDTMITGWQPGPDGIGLYLSDSTSLLAACVVIAAGTTPCTEWLRGSGLPLDNGVVCEATCHVVGAEDVVAAGDVAQWPNIRFDAVPRRIEHWLNAVEMGRAAAESLWAGRSSALPFTPMPRFWTEQYGVRIQAAGVPRLGTDTITLGTPDDGTGTVIGYVRAGKLMGVVGLDCPSSVLTWTETIRTQNPSPLDPTPATSDPEPTATPSRTRNRSRHSLPPKPKRTRSKIPAPLDSTPNLPPLTAPRLSAARFGPTASNPRIPIPINNHPTPTNGHPHPAAPNHLGPAASNSRLSPADPSRFGPAASNTRIPPAAPNGHPLAADSGRFGSAASNSRLSPADPSRFGPAASNTRIPPAPTNGNPLPAEPSGFGPAASNSRLHPADPSRFGPAVSNSRIPPAPTNGHHLPAEPGRFGPAASNTRIPPPASNGHRLPGDRPGPAGTNGRMIPADSSGRVPPPPPPSPTNGRLRPADPLASRPRIPPAERNDHHGPARQNGHQVPAQTNGHHNPEASNGRLRPLDINGHDLAQTNGHHVPPASNGRLRPLDINDRFGPAQSNGRIPPAQTNGRFGAVAPNGHVPAHTNGHDLAPPNGHHVPARQNGHHVPAETSGHHGPIQTNGHQVPAQTNGHHVPPASNGRLRPLDINGRFGPDQPEPAGSLYPDINERLASTESSGRIPPVATNGHRGPAKQNGHHVPPRDLDVTGWVPVVGPKSEDVTGWIPRVD